MADDYSDNTSTRGRLYAGSQTTGTLEAALDTDWFRLDLSAGSYYTFELSATSALDYYRSLVLYDARGGYLGGSYYTGDGVLTYTVKASATDTYYVGVRDTSSAGANTYSPLVYTLKASSGVQDEIGDTRATAQALVLGQKQAAVLEGSSDVDYFKVAVQAGVTYTIAPSWNPNGGNNLSGYIRLEDVDGTYVYTSNSFGTSSFTATRSGDYYVAVSNSYGPVTDYNIKVSAAADDYTASKSGAGQLAVGAAGTAGTLDVVGDRDWFATQLTVGTTYWFTLAPGTGGGTLYSGSSGVLKLIAEDGTVVATSSGYTYVTASTPLLLSYVPSGSGKYYLEVADGSYGSGKYQVRAVVGEADDHGDTRADATAIAAVSATSGKIAIPQDKDVFKLAVTAGHTYLVSLTGQGLSIGAVLELNGASAGNYNYDSLANYGKAGVDQYRVLTATTTGDYYFTVSTDGRSTGSYALNVSEPAGDDYASGTGTTGVLTVGGKVTGALDYTGDVDTFKVTLQYGAKYAFQLRGAGSGEGTLQSAQLQITGTDGIGTGYLNANGDGTYTFASTTGGDYYISVRPQNYYSGNSQPDMTGSYTLYGVALNGDTTAPTLLSHTPSQGARPLDNITLRFSEAIMRGDGGYITLRDSLGVTLETYYRDDTRLSYSGDTLTINPSLQLKPGGQYFLSLSNGSVTDLAGNKFAGSELLTIGTVPTVATGGAGDDFLLGLGVGSRLSGGAGLDTAIYGYDRSAYDVVRSATGTTVKKIWDNAAGTADTLDGVERLMFASVSVALDIDGTAGQAYRLYQAAFDRKPDLAGVGYWIAQMDHGLSLHDTARGFLNSGEFATRYGTALDDSMFVGKLYQNILHRAPDQGGFDYWVGVLGKGADRADVLAAVSESGENVAAVAQVIGNGFEYTPYG